jgi:hypothetical protein
VDQAMDEGMRDTKTTGTLIAVVSVRL